MQVFFLNIILMFAWAILTADFSESSLFQGFLIGWGVLWFSRPVLDNTNYFKRPRQIVDLLLYFFYQLFSSSLRVVWEILTPDQKSHPGIISLPLEVETESQLLLLSNLISLTPGTLSLDITEDRKTLYMHVMFLDDPDEVIQSVKSGIERRVINITT